MTAEAPTQNDSTADHAIVGAAVALALMVGLGFSAHKLGLLGSEHPLKAAAPIMAAISTLSDGKPERILISGYVVDAKEGPAIEARLHQLFPNAELKNSARTADQGAKQKPNGPKTSTVKLSFAADAINEAWPRPRFGDVKRLELVWKDGKFTLRGAVFTPAAKQTLDTAFAGLAKDAQGAAQIREVQRPLMPVADVQQLLSVALGGRTIAFDAAGAVAVDDAVVASLAPALTDLRGLEVWVSAGADDRALSQKQADAVKIALVAKGADAKGLRAVTAATNNPLSLIVREKE